MLRWGTLDFKILFEFDGKAILLKGRNYFPFPSKRIQDYPNLFF